MELVFVDTFSLHFSSVALLAFRYTETEGDMLRQVTDGNLGWE